MNKPKIMKINLSTSVHLLLNQGGAARKANVCFPLVSWENSLDGDSERYEWNGME